MSLLPSTVEASIFLHHRFFLPFPQPHPNLPLFLPFQLYQFTDYLQSQFTCPTASMAVLDDLGLEVTIEVAGEPAQEYPDPDHDASNNSDESPTHTCYIESRAGAEYSILGRVRPRKKKSPAAQWIAKDQKNALCFGVSFDGGNNAASTLCDQNNLLARVNGAINYVEQKQHMFCFSAVSTGTYAAVLINLLFITNGF